MAFHPPRPVETRRAIARAFRASGLTKAAFTVTVPVAPRSLTAYLREFAAEETARVSFVPVRITAATEATESRMTAQVGDTTLEFEVGTEVEYVAALARALKC